jgi:hypothetical protein
MRTSILLFVLLGSAILSAGGCKKEMVDTISDSLNLNLLNRITNPMVNAGSDVFVFLPADSCVLYASAYSKNGIASNVWRKVSGPPSQIISSPDSLSPMVDGLIEGVYEFELKVTDKEGLITTDTVSVTVREKFVREVTFKDIFWNLDPIGGENHLVVKNVYGPMPVGSVFRVFMKIDNSGGWVEAIKDGKPGLGKAWYLYYLNDFYLTVWSGYDEGGTADIMLVY